MTPAGIEYYLPLFFEHTETLFDYLAGTTTRCSCSARACSMRPRISGAQASERYEQRAHDIERPILPPAELYLPPQQLRERLNNELRVDIVRERVERARDRSRHATRAAAAAESQGRRTGRRVCKRFLAAYPGRVLIAADSAGRREALIEQLATAHLQPHDRVMRIAGTRASPPSSREIALRASPSRRSNRASH